MRITLFVVGALGFILAALAYLVAKSALHEIEALVLVLIGVAGCWAERDRCRDR
jgi:hypothetical protein